MAFLGYFFDLEAARAHLAGVRTGPILTGVAAFLLCQTLRALRWVYLVRREEPVGWGRGTQIWYAGQFLNIILPVRGGEVARLWFAKRAGGVSLATSTAATLVDRAFHILAILILVSAAPLAGFHLAGFSRGLTVLGLFTFAVVICVMVLGEPVVRALLRRVAGLAANLGASEELQGEIRDGALATYLREALTRSHIRRYRVVHLLGLLVLSLSAIAADGWCCQLVFGAFGVPMTLLQGMVGGAILNALSFFPSPPGQVGTSEIYQVAVFGVALGLPEARIATAAVFWHGIVLLLLGVLGVSFATALGLDLRRVRLTEPPAEVPGGPGAARLPGFEWAAILALLLLLHGPPLAMEGIYWDDWWLVGAPEAEVLATYSSTGTTRTGYLHAALNRTLPPGFPGSPFPWRLMHLLALGGTVFFLYRILEEIPAVRPRIRLAVCLLFLAFPVHPSRFIVILAPGPTAIMALFAGAWCYLQALKRRSPARRGLALVLFYLAYWMESLLVFHGLVVLLVIQHEWAGGRRDRGDWLRFPLRHPDLLLAPVLYFAITRTFYPATGVFEGYNSFAGIRPSLTSPELWWSIFQLNVTRPLVTAARELGVSGGGMVLVGAALLATAQCRVHEEDGGEDQGAPDHRRNLVLLAMGLVAFAAGVFPYMAVGKYPMAGWRDGVGMKFMDRLQVLVPLGGSLFVVYLVELLGGLGRARASWRAFVCWAVILSSGAVFWRTYAAYQRDWVKQRGLVVHLRESPIVARNHSFLVADPDRIGNVFGRFLRFFEYSALLRMATGEQTRFAVLEERRQLAPWLRERFLAASWHLRDHVPGPFEVRIRVDADAARLGSRSVLEWWWLEVSDTETFEREAAAAVRVEIRELPRSKGSPSG